MRILSGIQPSNSSLHLGNYIGSILNWKKMIAKKQNNDEFLWMVADLHALTTCKKPEELKHNIKSLIATYLACGIKAEDKVSFFIQSKIPAHCELCWILSTICSVGHLERMTQFKDKKERLKTNEDINAGLLYYPILMASDILLYKTNKVPVGEDQNQHLEFTRDIVDKFNNLYGDNDIFVKPEGLIDKTSKRIMSLGDGTKKMSKSIGEEKDKIFLTDTNEQIEKKIKSAKTDSITGIFFDKNNRPEISNLITIMSALSNRSVEDISDEYKNKNTKTFKDDLTSIIINEISPIREKFYQYLENDELLDNVINKGTEKAQKIASDTLAKVKEKIGIE